MTRMTALRLSGAAACVLLAACGEAEQEEARSPAAEAPAPPLLATSLFAPAGEPPLEFSRGGGETVPARLGIGRAASPAEIAALDIDVLPDGTGLPAGGATAAEGTPIYAAKCAACHGAGGTGGVDLALVAPDDRQAFTTGEHPDAFATRTVGNYWPYATTLFDYIRRSMPFDRPGSLTDHEVYALTAWLLWQNGIVGEDDVMDATSLPLVEMPAHSRFTADDRLTSTRVR